MSLYDKLYSLIEEMDENEQDNLDNEEIKRALDMSQEIRRLQENFPPGCRVCLPTSFSENNLGTVVAISDAAEIIVRPDPDEFLNLETLVTLNEGDIFRLPYPDGFQKAG